MSISQFYKYLKRLQFISVIINENISFEVIYEIFGGNIESTLQQWEFIFQTTTMGIHISNKLCKRRFKYYNTSFFYLNFTNLQYFNNCVVQSSFNRDLLYHR